MKSMRIQNYPVSKLRRDSGLLATGGANCTTKITMISKEKQMDGLASACPGQSFTVTSDIRRPGRSPSKKPESGKMPLLPSSHLRLAAFSLLEIVVSTAIVAVLSLIMLQILSKMLDASKVEMARMDAYANGRNVLELMSRDMSKTWVEQGTSSTNNNIAWKNVPPGSEMNWRSIYARFNTNATSTNATTYIDSTNTLFILYSGAIPITRGSADSGLRAIGYGLSNGMLIRYQKVLIDSADNTPTLAGINAPGGVTNDQFIITDYQAAVANQEVIAENIYWMKIEVPSTFTDAATNRLPTSITLTMRAASRDIMQKIKRNPSLAGDILYLGDSAMTNSAQLTNAGIREISMTIPLNQ